MAHLERSENYGDKMKEILIVGAGFSGATIANYLANIGFKIHIIEKRDHIAGNAYDFNNENGIRVHKYGPHIFHTNNDGVFSYLKNFGEWVEYHHKVKCMLDDGSLVTIPPNIETKERLGEENIVDILFRPYTKKMWGMEIEEIDPKIIERVAIRDDRNELYFPNDQYQYMPRDGYTSIIENMLDHPNISLDLRRTFDKSDEVKYDHVFNSMPIDEYYDFECGELPYRSIRFCHQDIPVPRLLSLPTINLVNDGKFTRVTEWKNYPNHGENKYFTSLTWEEPCCYKENFDERYYPVKDASGKNREIYEEYRSRVKENVTFIGRCGLYVYLDMHQAISSSLAIAKRYEGQVHGQ